jgi:acetyl-CoA synthetase
MGCGGHRNRRIIQTNGRLYNADVVPSCRERDPAGFAWMPSPDRVQGSVLARFLRYTGMTDFDSLASRADRDPAWLNEQVLAFCDFRFYRPYTRILDTQRGIEHADWCVGGTTNIVLNCLERHRDTAAWDSVFLVWEGEDGAVSRFTYGQFESEVARLAGGLCALGVRQGDRIALYLPNIPEAFIALFAALKLGAIAVPLFSGFGPQPLAQRLRDAEVHTVLTADGGWRKGSFLPMVSTLDDALWEVPSAQHLVVLNRAGGEVATTSAVAYHDWAELVRAPNPEAPTAELPAEAPAVLLYTSGTTGRPKGCIWTHLSFLASMALRDMHICGDFTSADRFFFMSDMGWMIGPMSAFVPSYFGASVLLAEGTPEHPRRDRFWKLVDDHDVTYLGVSPTIVRSLMRHGSSDVSRFRMRALRMTCSGGEPWNDAAWNWFFEHVCRRELPIINLVGGTEVCGCNFVGTVIHPMRPGSFGARGLGCGVDIVDASGRPVPDDTVGELVLRNPGIGMTKGIWGDSARYLASYWQAIPGVWTHGDFAKRDRQGLYYVLGRSDDTIKVAGKRTGPAELESVLTDTGEVSEAAVIGVPDDVSGSALVCVCVPMPGVPREQMSLRLSNALVARMGASYRPRCVYLADDLPKTRNMKIMRRVIRAAFLRQPPGDLSSLANPESVEALARLFAAGEGG